MAHPIKTALVSMIIGAAAFVFAPKAAHANVSCSANCLIGSCSISCPGSAGGGVCGCYAGIIAVCSCGGGGSSFNNGAATASERQAQNSYDVLNYLEGLGTAEGDTLAQLLKDIMIAEDGNDFATYSKSATAFKSTLKGSTTGTLDGLIDYAEALPTPPEDCETPRKAELDVNVGGTVEHQITGCSYGNGGLSASGGLVFAAALMAFARARRRRAPRA